MILVSSILGTYSRSDACPAATTIISHEYHWDVLGELQAASIPSAVVTEVWCCRLDPVHRDCVGVSVLCEVDRLLLADEASQLVLIVNHSFLGEEKP